jgi:hypothetical protein
LYGDTPIGYDFQNVVNDVFLPKFISPAMYRWVCAKEIDVSSIPEMKERVIQLMCLLEKVFPPAFFDIQIHLVSHLVEEVEIAGTVHARWMFWVERYMKVLKGYVRQAAKPEGCMQSGHLHYESMFFASQAVELFDAKAPTAWEDAEDGADISSLKLLGKKTQRTLSLVEKAQIHRYVLNNDSRLVAYRREYAERKLAFTGPGVFPAYQRWLTGKVDSLTQAQERGHAVSDLGEIQDILKGPRANAYSYTRMKESGRLFRIYSYDRNRRSTTDCGVYALGVQTNRAGVDEMVPFCGKITDIVEVNFGSFEIVLVGAVWYRSGSTTLVSNDPCGFIRVNTSLHQPRNTYASEVWIYPHQVDQCFYVPMIDMPTWEIVVPLQPRRQRLMHRDTDISSEM